MIARSPDLLIRPERLSCETVRRLFAALDAELFERYPEEGAVFNRLDEVEVAPGRGVMLVAYADGRVAGCVALRLFDTERAELKRMYVVPAMRGRGIGRAMVDALTIEALRLGASRLVLETGDRLVEATALYERAGFVPIPLFGEYADSPLSTCMAKELLPAHPEALEGMS